MSDRCELALAKNAGDSSNFFYNFYIIKDIKFKTDELAAMDAYFRKRAFDPSLFELFAKYKISIIAVHPATIVQQFISNNQ